MYQNTPFVIFAKDIPEAFVPYKRILYHKAGTLEDFENDLLKDKPDIRNCLLLFGNSVNRNMVKDILKPYQKSSIELITTRIEPKTVKVDHHIEYDPNVATELHSDYSNIPTPIKRGRGRPKGSKNKPKIKSEQTSNSLDSHFE